jgi:hypothetical protein
LEDQITIVSETTSHENKRRDRHPLRVGTRESRDFFSRPLAQATLSKFTETPENPRRKRPSRG